MIAIYTRLSQEDEKSNSVKNQQLEGKLFAKSNGWEYVFYNEGEGLSGTLGLDERPELARLYEDIAEGLINRVWFRDQNRLSRNELLYHKFLEHFKKNEVEVYFADKLFNYNNPTSVAMSSIKATFDALRVLEQSIATKRAIKNNVKLGKVHGAINYGYKEGENKQLVVDEAEAEVIRNIFKWSLEKIGSNAIGRRLDALGIPTRTRSKKWRFSTILRIIKNPLYKGQRIHNGEVYEAPRIIDDATWEKANKNLTAMRRYSGKRTSQNYLLSKLAYCGRCGKRVSGRTNRKHNKNGKLVKEYNVYVCTSKRQRLENCGERTFKLEILEEFIWTKLILDKRLSNLVLEHFKTTDNTDEIERLKKELKVAEGDIKKIQRDKDKLVQLAVEGVLEVADIKNKMAELKANLKRAKNREKDLKEVIESKEMLEVEKDSIVADLNSLVNQSKREVVEKYIESLYLSSNEDGYHLKINFTIDNLSNEYYIPFDYKYATSYLKGKAGDVEVIILDDSIKELPIKVFIPEKKKDS